MNARLYIRVSRDEQVKFGYSIDSQIAALKKYAKENKMIIKGMYVDEGISAATIKKRKELQRMMFESQNGDIILFTRLDRFSRNVLDANILLKELDVKNVSIKAIYEEDVDTSTADGRFIFNLKINIAELERNKTGERINDIFKYKAKQGESISGKIPFGYKVINKRYVPHEEESIALLDLFNYYSVYHNLTATTKWFNDKYPQYKMELNSLKIKLSNKIYIGIHKYNNDFCPIIVPVELFNTVQEHLKRNISSRKINSVFIFSKLIFCGKCGRVMVGNRTIRKYPDKPNWNDGVYYVYRCNHAYQNHMCKNRKILSESKIEKFLLDNVKLLLNDYIIDFERKNKPKKDNKNDIAQIKKRMTKLKNLYLDDIIQIEDYENEYYELKVKLERLSNIRPKTVNMDLIKLMDINISKTYETLTREEKQALWHSVIKKIIFINHDEYEIVFI